MKYRVLALGLIALSAGCGPRATRAAGGSWYQLRTPRFQVWTDGDPETARTLVLDLERFHQVMRSLTKAEEREAAPPLRIFMAKDNDSLRALTGGPRGFAGMMKVTMRGNYALIDASGLDVEADDIYRFSSRVTLFHEYTHFMQAAQGAQIPSWYNEGFAEYMSTTRFLDEGRFTIGCVPQHRAAWIKYLEWLPMEKVLASDNVASLEGSRSAHQTGTRLGPSHNPADAYAQSWLAVHYLLADGARKQQLHKYLELWGQGVAPADASQQAFGMSPDELDRVLQAYARQHELDCVAVVPDKPFALPEVEVVPLGTGAAHYHVGDLLLATLGPTEEALEVLQQAAELDPNDPATLRALARAHWLKLEQATLADERTAEIGATERYLQQAVQRESDAPEALALGGHLHRVKAALAREAEQPYGEELLAARKAYRGAIRADEALAEAYLGLGATYLIEDNGSKEAQVALEAAGYLLPLNTTVALLLGKVHLQRHDAVQARPALEYVTRWTSDDGQRNEARTALDQLTATAARVPAAETK